MTLTFQRLLRFQPTATDFLYVLALDPQPSNAPWVGLFAHAVQGDPGFTTVTLDAFFKSVVPNLRGIPHSGFLFLPVAPDQSGVADFYNSLLAASQTFGFPSFGQTVTHGGFALWLS